MIPSRKNKCGTLGWSSCKKFQGLIWTFGGRFCNDQNLSSFHARNPSRGLKFLALFEIRFFSSFQVTNTVGFKLLVRWVLLHGYGSNFDHRPIFTCRIDHQMFKYSVKLFDKRNGTTINKKNRRSLVNCWVKHFSFTIRDIPFHSILITNLIFHPYRK